MTSSTFRLRFALSIALAGLAAVPAAAGPYGFSLSLDTVATGLVRPIGLAHAGDGSGRLFVVLQGGQIRVLEADGTLLPTPFLNLSGQVSCCGERGLLGLAFHPAYETNGLFYVHYTDLAGDTVVSRFSVSADPDVADSGSESVLLTQDQPFSNHNGGQLAFGPDGFLYVALGDGGSGGDPQDNAQDLSTILGKILRIDVDSTSPGLAYGIPPGNPFAGTLGARPEIWAYGLRNPWRFSFDRQTGDLWIGDVGQNAIEEIDLQPAAAAGGRNYGWRCFEGSQPFNQTGCPASGFTFPVLEYGHVDGNCSVTGGYRYRGAAQPLLTGVYLFADFCTGRLWGADRGCGGTWHARQIFDAPFNVTSFGEDEAGEVYVVEAGATDGKIHRLVASPTLEIFADGFESGDLAAWSRCTVQ